MELKFKKLHPDAKLPTYATPGSACFDFYSMENVWLSRSHTFQTGLAVEIPEGHVLQIHSRSGMGFNQGIRLANCTGIIDADYRGEICIKLFVDGHGHLEINPGDRIAQGILLKADQVGLSWSDELSETERGSGGFGSTGN